jgi:hypothetical protein
MDAGGAIGEGVNTSGTAARGGAAGIGGYGAAMVAGPGAGTPANGADDGGGPAIGAPTTGGGADVQGAFWQQC